MSMTYADSSGSRTAQAAAYGGLVDAIGGIATVVLAIVALSGFNEEPLVDIATIVFGGALLIQAGTILSEYASVAYPGTLTTQSTLAASAAGLTTERFSRGGLSVMFIAGAVGIVLGILALVGVVPTALTSIAVIIFGTALAFSSNAVREIQMLQASSPTRVVSTTSELLADEMAAGSAGVQVLTGLAAIVLGIIALTGMQMVVLTAIGLLIVGATLVLTGSTLSALVLSFMRPAKA